MINIHTAFRKPSPTPEPAPEARQAVNTVDSLGALFRAHLTDIKKQPLTRAAWSGKLELIS